MADQDTQSNTEAQKTVIAFIAGLVIGGLLVFIFGGTSSSAPSLDTDNDTNVASEDMDASDDADMDTSGDTSAPSETTNPDAGKPSNTLETGDAAVRVSDQRAGSSVTLGSVTFPTDEGWIGVRDYANDEIGNILGVARYSKSAGLTPKSIDLVRPTIAGHEYAIVFFKSNGDRTFSSTVDTQIGGAVDTFKAE
jgi:hypothetical protein